ncbi:MAG: hypothetical protein JSR77_01305 [Planctomycetes bacterium]|nr:hypothetical protein [Planctomycetota bacterium]
MTRMSTQPGQSPGTLLPRAGRWCIVAGSLFALTAQGGCWHTTSANTDRMSAAPATISAEAWPKRDAEPVRTLAERTPGYIYDYCLSSPTPDWSKIDEAVAERLKSPKFVVEYVGLHGNGLIRIFSKPTKPHDDYEAISRTFQSLLTGFIPNATYVSSRTLGANPSASVRAEASAYDRPNGFLRDTGKPYEVCNAANECFLESGIDLRFPPHAVSTPRGLILHLQSLAGNDYEPQVLDYLRSRGWAVIDIKTATGVTPPVRPADTARVAELDPQIAAVNMQLFDLGDVRNSKDQRKRKKAAALRAALDKLTEERDRLARGSYQVDPKGDLEPVAIQIASDIDQTLAGNAYAVEAVLDYALKQRPDLCSGPIVVMGFSAGALATPTAVARVRDKIDAVVMVGGAADMFLVSQHSTLTSGGVILRHGTEEVPPRTIRELDRLYLKHSKLDPYHTAPVLNGIPVLLLDAAMDTWVPTECCDLLYQRLGRPERARAHLAGHMLLFYTLPSRNEQIADWLGAVQRRSTRE